MGNARERKRIDATEHGCTVGHVPCGCEAGVRIPFIGKRG